MSTPNVTRLPEAIRERFSVRRVGPTYVIRCPGCAARWIYPIPKHEMAGGAVLKLLDHAYSHKQEKPTV